MEKLPPQFHPSLVQLHAEVQIGNSLPQKILEEFPRFRRVWAQCLECTKRRTNRTPHQEAGARLLHLVPTLLLLFWTTQIPVGSQVEGSTRHQIDCTGLTCEATWGEYLRNRCLRVWTAQCSQESGNLMLHGLVGVKVLRRITTRRDCPYVHTRAFWCCVGLTLNTPPRS